MRKWSHQIIYNNSSHKRGGMRNVIFVIRWRAKRKNNKKTQTHLITMQKQKFFGTRKKRKRINDKRKIKRNDKYSDGDVVVVYLFYTLLKGTRVNRIKSGRREMTKLVEITTLKRSIFTADECFVRDEMLNDLQNEAGWERERRWRRWWTLKLAHTHQTVQKNQKKRTKTVNGKLNGASYRFFRRLSEEENEVIRGCVLWERWIERNDRKLSLLWLILAQKRLYQKNQIFPKN